MSGMRVINAGIFTLIQDDGRHGFSDIGISSSGAMDKYSYYFLNKLLENKKDTNCLEVTFGNLKLQSKVDTFVATTGVECEFSINGKRKRNWMVHKVNIGDRIRIGRIPSGQKVYLGVKDGFNLKKELGSTSTTIKEKLGGINGDRLKNNITLKCNSFLKLPTKRVKQEFIPIYEGELILRVIFGYQEDKFSSSEKRIFFNSFYEVTPQINRMGYRLKGTKIKSSLSSMVSEAISYGAIQIPKDGQPIILLNDRQTIGGYPKIGTVLALDCYKLSQANIGTKVRFEEISLEKAVSITKEFTSFFI